MPKLNDTQLVMLNAAARRKVGLLLPLPKSLKGDKAAIDKVIATLLRRKLVEERPASAGKPFWRETEDQRLTLIITDAGREAIGVEVEPAAANTASNARSKKTDNGPATGGKTIRPNSKTSALVELLRGPHGATIPDAMEATGWQAHSVRGAISGMVKKKLSLTVATAVEEGRGRVYRIIMA